MDFSRVVQLRDELLQNRRLAITIGIAVAAFWAVTLIGGYLLVRHALEDNTITARALNTPTQIGLLLDDEPDDTMYHIVYFNDVKLESGPTDDVYFAVGPKGQSVLVLATGSKAPPDSTTVDVQGTVRPLPPTGTLRKKWKLTKQQVKAVKEHGIYVEAEEITSIRPARRQQLAAKK